MKNLELGHNIISENLEKILNTTKASDANAAVVILLRSTKQGFQVLFVKRAKKSTDPWSGQTALPGGKREPEDRNLKQTIIRETLEETSINLLEGCRFLGEMEQFTSIQKPDMKITPFVVMQENEQNIKLNNELTEYFWTTLKEIDHNKGTVKFGAEKFPAYIMGNQKIWGLTYKIVDNLLSLLSAIEKGKTR